jgi:Endonuclease/Exonuclease/phosphatase family.
VDGREGLILPSLPPALTTDSAITNTVDTESSESLPNEGEIIAETLVTGCSSVEGISVSESVVNLGSELDVDLESTLGSSLTDEDTVLSALTSEFSPSFSSRSTEIMSNLNPINQNLARDFSLYPKCFKCVHFNAQSVPAHLHEIRTIIEDVDLHVILISESWLKPSLSDNLVRIPGYVLLRHDRGGKRGGGVAAYVRDDLPHKVIARSVPSPLNPGPEYMAVQVTLRNVKLLVVVVYNPPDVHNLNGIDELLSDYMPFVEHIIIMGDFNIDVSIENLPQTLKLKNLISLFNLHLLQTGPTHLFHNTNRPTTIDLMVVLQQHKVISYGTLPAPGISRHDMLYLAYSIKVPKYPVKFITHRDIKGIDSAALSESLGSLDWEPLLSESDIRCKPQS